MVDSKKYTRLDFLAIEPAGGMRTLTEADGSQVILHPTGVMTRDEAADIVTRNTDLVAEAEATIAAVAEKVSVINQAVVALAPRIVKS